MSIDNSVEELENSFTTYIKNNTGIRADNFYNSWFQLCMLFDPSPQKHIIFGWIESLKKEWQSKQPLLSISDEELDKMAFKKYPRKKEWRDDLNGYYDVNEGGRDGFKEGYKAALKTIKGISIEDVIEWTDWLGEMGWYREKDGKWHHDNETGYFESAEKLFYHYHPEYLNTLNNSTEKTIKGE